MLPGVRSAPDRHDKESFVNMNGGYCKIAMLHIINNLPN